MCLICVMSLCRPIFGNYTVFYMIYGCVIYKISLLISFAIILMPLHYFSCLTVTSPTIFTSLNMFKTDGNQLLADDHSLAGHLVLLPVVRCCFLLPHFTSG